MVRGRAGVLEISGPINHSNTSGACLQTRYPIIAAEFPVLIRIASQVGHKTLRHMGSERREKIMTTEYIFIPQKQKSLCQHV